MGVPPRVPRHTLLSECLTGREKGRGAGAREGRAGPGSGSRGRQRPHLLALLDTQLTTDLDALDGVDEEVSRGILHLVLVEGAREVPAQEDDSVGQQLGVSRAWAQRSVWAAPQAGTAMAPRPCSLTSHPPGPAPFAGRQENGSPDGRWSPRVPVTLRPGVRPSFSAARELGPQRPGEPKCIISQSPRGAPRTVTEGMAPR